MKQTVLTKILNCALVLLGFASTTSCEHIGQIACEYGTPTMDFKVSGKVVSQDSAPIAGIKVSCHVFTAPGIVTAHTAADGSFSISGTGMSPLLEFEDIDGPENGGEFAGKTEEIKVNKVKEGDGHWYRGEYEANDVVIRLERK